VARCIGAGPSGDPRVPGAVREKLLQVAAALRRRDEQQSQN
jgi:hypothetical protein